MASIVEVDLLGCGPDATHSDSRSALEVWGEFAIVDAQGEQGGRRRVRLEVPFAQKDAAKRAGARWDPVERSWFAPSGLTPELAQWAPRAPIPELLPGEDRSFGGGLFVDAVPTSCWFTNVRSRISDRDWDRVRRMVLARAAHRCEACTAPEDGGGGARLEVHERWEYSVDQVADVGTQSLRRLICLCNACHTATHFGLAQIRGLDAQARAHLGTVRGMSSGEVDAHVESARQIWLARNQRTWSLDLGILVAAGIELLAPPDADRRAELAAGQVRDERR